MTRRLQLVLALTLTGCSQGSDSVDVGPGLVDTGSGSATLLGLDTAFADDRYVTRHGAGTVDGPMHIDGKMFVDNANLYLVSDTSPQIGPELHLSGYNGSWLLGIDVANNGGSRDLVLAAKVEATYTQDVLYLAQNEDSAPTFGIGMTPPGESHRVQITAQDSIPQMGSLMVRRTPQQTGDLLTVIDSGGAPLWRLDSDLWLKGANPTTGASVSIKADDTYGRALTIAQADGNRPYGFVYASDGSGLALRAYDNNIDNVVLTASGRPNFPNGITTDSLRIAAPSVPATSSSPCTQGDVAYDSDFLYVCVATNTWKRSALQTW